MRECVPLVLRWSEAVASLIGVRRPERKKTAAISRTTASHLDYFYEEVEEIMAELVVVVATLSGSDELDPRTVARPIPPPTATTAAAAATMVCVRVQTIPAT